MPYRVSRDIGTSLWADWSCSFLAPVIRDCAPQPMMTLRYGVVGEGLTGSTAAGQQVIKVAVGHFQLASQRSPA
ncbi:MAG: hypothetical protein ACRDNF_13450 [Streptosporangiaceae bacterium]